MKRSIIKIDEEKCTGCGMCIPNCQEGALQIIDGKARLISDLFCDGLGACIGHCPEGAMTIEEREAEEYDEYRVMENVSKGGPNVIKAHLQHMRDHNQELFLEQAIDYLKKNNLPVPEGFEKKTAVKEPVSTASKCGAGGCPGSMMMDFSNKKKEQEDHSSSTPLTSQLRQWPIQLQLLNPYAPYLKNAHLVIAADCVPFAYADFHRRFLKDKTLIMFCPKLDKTLDQYVEKLTEIFNHQNIQSITLVHMEVPCCFGVERVIQEALQRSGKNILVKDYTISISGDII